MSYILTVVSGGNLEYVGNFAGWKAANESALLWAKAFVSRDDFIDYTPNEEASLGSLLWRFVDTNKLQISVRCMAALTDVVQVPTHLWVKSKLPTPPPVMKPVWTPIMKSVPSIQVVTKTAPKDDPFADHLPGGWDRNGKPLTVGQIKDDQSLALAVGEMSADQEWSLVQARISKRPNCLFLLKPEDGATGLYSQLHALREVRHKTLAGSIIAVKELNTLKALLGEAESEDPQMMDGVDESSSSDSFDHY